MRSRGRRLRLSRDVTNHSPWSSPGAALFKGGMMSEAAILTALERGVFTITLNRPKVNALTTEVVSALQAIFKQAERNPEVRCVLLTGQGRVFSAGQDLTEVKQD